MDLKKLHENNPDLEFTTVKPKIIYKFLLQSKLSKPKALVNNPCITQDSCINLRKLKSKPRVKQHMFNQINNIIPTKERLFRCKQSKDPSCTFCPTPESNIHIFGTSSSKLATEWLMREMEKIDKKAAQAPQGKIIVLNFEIESNVDK